MSQKELNQGWANWIKEIVKKYDPEDCWFATLGFGKNPPGRAKVVMELNLDKTGADLARKRWISDIEKVEGFKNNSLVAFWVDPIGSMGNRHYHVIMITLGLSKVSKVKWTYWWNQYAGKGSSAVIKQLNEGSVDYIDYMTSYRNLGSGEVKIRGQV